jgi:hypothetical protein
MTSWTSPIQFSYRQMEKCNWIKRWRKLSERCQWNWQRSFEVWCTVIPLHSHLLLSVLIARLWLDHCILMNTSGLCHSSFMQQAFGKFSRWSLAKCQSGTKGILHLWNQFCEKLLANFIIVDRDISRRTCYKSTVLAIINNGSSYLKMSHLGTHELN